MQRGSLAHDNEATLVTLNNQGLIQDEGWTLVNSKRHEKLVKKPLEHRRQTPPPGIVLTITEPDAHLLSYPEGINEAEVANLKDRSVSCDSPDWRPWPAPMSLREAHRLIGFASIKPLSKLQIAARRRLLALYDTFSEGKGRDFVYEAFLDLDTLLFQGALRRRVYIEWSNAPQTERNSISFVSRPSAEPWNLPRTTIHLDHEWAWLGSWWCHNRQRVWGNLIHEMLHCFLQVTVARPYGLDLADQETCCCQARVFHGQLWLATVGRLAAMAQLPDMEADDIDSFDGHCHRWNNAEEQRRNLARDGTPPREDPASPKRYDQLKAVEGDG